MDRPALSTKTRTVPRIEFWHICLPSNKWKLDTDQGKPGGCCKNMKTQFVSGKMSGKAHTYQKRPPPPMMSIESSFKTLNTQVSGGIISCRTQEMRMVLSSCSFYKVACRLISRITSSLSCSSIDTCGRRGSIKRYTGVRKPCLRIQTPGARFFSTRT